MDNKADTMEVKKCVKERPILFNGPMVRAILDGRKTQTRRIVKIKNRDLYSESTFLHGGCAAVALGLGTGSITDFREQENSWFGLSGYKTVVCIDRPYSRIGDQLWVRERIMVRPERSAKDMREGADTWPRCVYMADGRWYGRKIDLAYAVPADYNAENEKEVWRECGFTAAPSIHMPRWASRITLEVTGVRVERLQDISEADSYAEGAQEWAASVVRDGNKFPSICKAYRALWESINGPGSWDANPWVWVVEFRRLP